MVDIKSLNNNDPREVALSKAIENLSTKIDAITEFDLRELRAISILFVDPIYREVFAYYLEHKKHLKRKFAKELTKFYELSTKDTSGNKKLLERLFRRDVV